MKFDVRALSAQQQIEAFELEALDTAHAQTLVQARGLALLSLKAAAGKAWLPMTGGGRSKPFDLLLFAQELLALVSAGLSVVEALDALLERAAQSHLKAVLQRLRDALQQGQRLSQALAQQGEVFPPLFVGVVQAAEGTSDLPRALERYVSYETRLRTLKHKVVSAAIYPSILFCVGLAVALFLLGYVVPRFASVYQGGGRSLPWASQVLLGWGQFAAHYALWLVAGLAVAVVALVWGARRLLRTGQWGRLLRVLPGVRQRLEILTLTRLYLTLGMLLDGGIPIMRAMQLCEAVLPQDTVGRLQAARGAVGQGESLSGALERQGLAT
ncbi:MAG: type II secretion system F family protein, partial [Hylemonella sp.]